jgi:beta-galactosidase
MQAPVMQLGVCYYPEHWPEERWASDAARMVDIGLTHVRIGEFAWSRIEPEPGQFDWGWLDRAVDVLHNAGLKIILGTPTATPPKWLVDQMPDMIAADQMGCPRGFGSRRHYCFAHIGYREESARITLAVAERYGNHPAITAWQTDNEYGCHDSAISYSNAARDGFRLWLARRYGGDISALNAAWGNVFWSMEYQSFAEIDLPNLTVTEANPAHWLDFRRFSSDQVVAFNRRQVDILRACSPGRDVMHNYMGFFTQFDHHDVARDLDVVGWDSYPLGFLEQFWFSAEDKARYMRQGHPDIAAFHHDLYRGCTPNGRWWVIEQQPGPVNWARYNPAPLPGMVRLWTWEAAAHGAELVSYFRWRQFPQAQEQMHAGLLRPDDAEDVGAKEARQVAAEIAQLGYIGETEKSVALIFAYDAAWVTDIQPQGAGFSALQAAFGWYSALRQWGLNVDIIPPSAALGDYKMVVVPCLPILPDDLVARLAEFDGPVVLGPRTGSKTDNLGIVDGLPPGAALRSLIPITITRVESLRRGHYEQGDGFTITRWLDHVDSELEPTLQLKNGRGVAWESGHITYVAGCLDSEQLGQILAEKAQQAKINVIKLSQSVRFRHTNTHGFAVNYGSEKAQLPLPENTKFMIGNSDLGPADVAIWPLD